MANGSTSVNQKGRSASSSGGSRETMIVGLFVSALAVFLAATLLRVWPTTVIEDGVVVWVNLTEVTALAIVMISGALGAFVHVATSFASYAGNRSLSASWVWWFMLRPAIGSAMALIAYFILRSGLLLDGNLGTDVTPFGIAALSGMIGLVSKQFIDKLKNVSDSAFENEQDEQRIDKL